MCSSSLDPLAELRQLVGDLGALELGQALQAQLEDRLGLALRQPVGVRRAGRRGIVGRLLGRAAAAARRRRARQSRALSSVLAVAGSGAARISAMISSMLATATRQPEQDVRPLARAARDRTRCAGAITSSRNSRNALSTSLSVELQRPAADQRHQVDAEADLQRRVAEQLVEHDVGIGLALELDHHARAVAVALVAQLGDALDRRSRTSSPIRSTIRALLTW